MLKGKKSFLFTEQELIWWFTDLLGGQENKKSGWFHRGRNGVCCVSAHRCLSEWESSQRSTYPDRKVMLFPRGSLILSQIRARGSVSCPAEYLLHYSTFLLIDKPDTENPMDRMSSPHLASLCVCHKLNSGSSLCFNCRWIVWWPSVVSYTINRRSTWNLFQTGWVNSELCGGQSENRAALIELKHCISISWAKFYGWTLLTLKTIWETMQRSRVCEGMSHAPQNTLRFPSADF